MSIFSIRHSATVSLGDRILVLGGNDAYDRESGQSIRDIAQFDSNGWTLAGKLIQARDSHNAIVTEHGIMVVGGLDHKNDFLKTEIWSTEKEISLSTDFLNKYALYPALIANHYCSL